MCKDKRRNYTLAVLSPGSEGDGFLDADAYTGDDGRRW